MKTLWQQSVLLEYEYIWVLSQAWAGFCEATSRGAIGPVALKVPRVRDRGKGAVKIRFTSSMLPPTCERPNTLRNICPWLYLKGISTGDFQEALTSPWEIALWGSTSTIFGKLKPEHEPKPPLIYSSKLMA